MRRTSPTLGRQQSQSRRSDSGEASVGLEESACDLRVGAIIQGHVVTQRTHSTTEKTSEIAVIFESGQCGGRDMKALFLTFAAVVAPYPSRSSDLPGTEELQPLSSAVGLTLNANVRSISQASATVYFEPRRAKPGTQCAAQP